MKDSGGWGPAPDATRSPLPYRPTHPISLPLPPDATRSPSEPGLTETMPALRQLSCLCEFNKTWRRPWAACGSSSKDEGLQEGLAALQASCSCSCLCRAPLLLSAPRFAHLWYTLPKATETALTALLPLSLKTPPEELKKKDGLCRLRRKIRSAFFWSSHICFYFYFSSVLFFFRSQRSSRGTSHQT